MRTTIQYGQFLCRCVHEPRHRFRMPVTLRQYRPPIRNRPIAACYGSSNYGTRIDRSGRVTNSYGK